MDNGKKGMRDLFADFEGHNTVLLRHRLPVDLPAFNLQVPLNESKPYPLNTRLRAMAETLA